MKKNGGNKGNPPIWRFLITRGCARRSVASRKNLKIGVSTLYTIPPVGGGVYTPKSLVWGPFNPPLTSYRPAFDPTGVLWVVAYVHPWGHMSHMRSYGVPGSKNRLFGFCWKLFWDGQNGPKTPRTAPKIRFYGSTMAPQGAQTSEI